MDALYFTGSARMAHMADSSGPSSLPASAPRGHAPR
jgi:hypothetical protein